MAPQWVNYPFDNMGAFKPNGMSGMHGQILQSNGDYMAPQWVDYPWSNSMFGPGNYTYNRIGFGTNNPTEAVDIMGNLSLNGAFKANGMSGMQGQILQSMGNNISPQWVDNTMLSSIPSGQPGQVLTFNGPNMFSWQNASGGGGNSSNWYSSGGITSITEMIRIADGTQGANKVLTSDANGNASWQTASSSSSGWGLNGNVITNSNNFIGTTNPMPLILKVNNEISARIESDQAIGNVSFGYRSAPNNSGTFNSSFGTYSLISNSSGILNSSLGFASLFANTTGNRNTATGSQALYSNTTGSNNTSIGNFNMYSNTTASDNTSIGYNSLSSNSIGEKNTAVGAISNNGSGSENTSIGYASFANMVNGGYNTAIGARADISTVSSIINATVIGYNAKVSVSNTMVLGNTSVVGWGFGTEAGSAAFKVGSSSSNGNGATLTLGGVWTNASDSTKKFNILPINYGLREVLKLKPVSYKMKGSGYNDIGFLAQEVKLVIPEIVYGNQGDMSLSYGQLTSVLTKAIQEQQVEIEAQKSQNELLQKQVLEMQKQLEVIQQLLKK